MPLPNTAHNVVWPASTPAVGANLGAATLCSTSVAFTTSLSTTGSSSRCSRLLGVFTAVPVQLMEAFVLLPTAAGSLHVQGDATSRSAVHHTLYVYGMHSSECSCVGAAYDATTSLPFDMLRSASYANSSVLFASNAMCR
jgi:hypothetical protein